MSSTRKQLSPETLLGALQGLGEVAPATLYAGFAAHSQRTVRRAMATLVASGAVVASGEVTDPTRTYRAVVDGAEGADPEPATGMSTDDALVAARHDRLNEQVRKLTFENDAAEAGLISASAAAAEVALMLETIVKELRALPDRVRTNRPTLGPKDVDAIREGVEMAVANVKAAAGDRCVATSCGQRGTTVGTRATRDPAMGFQIEDPDTGELRDETPDEAYDAELHRVVTRVPGSVLRHLDRDAAQAGLSRMGITRLILERAAEVQQAGEALAERQAELVGLRDTVAKAAVALNISLQLVAEAIAAREGGITITSDEQRHHFLERATAAVHERQRELVGGSGEVH